MNLRAQIEEGGRGSNQTFQPCQAKRTVFVDKVGKDSRLWMTRRELSMNLKARLAQLQEPYIELTDFTVRCFLDMLFHLEQLHV